MALTKTWLSSNRPLVDAMNADVDVIRIITRINEPADSLDLGAVFEANSSDLANASHESVRGFYIDRYKAGQDPPSHCEPNLSHKSPNSKNVG
jgi:hypothetical protein